MTKKDHERYVRLPSFLVMGIVENVALVTEVVHGGRVTDVRLGMGRRIGALMARREPSYVGDRLLTVVEVATLMRVSNMTVYRLIKAGDLAAIRVGKNYRIREKDVGRYLSERAVRVDEI